MWASLEGQPPWENLCEDLILKKRRKRDILFLWDPARVSLPPVLVCHTSLEGNGQVIPSCIYDTEVIGTGARILPPPPQGPPLFSLWQGGLLGGWF